METAALGYSHVVLMDMCLLFRQRRIFARAEVPRLGPALAGRPPQRCRAASDLRRRLRMYQRRRRRPGALATRRQTLPVLRFQRMIGKLQVPIVSAGGAALVAIDDLQIPMQTALIRPEPLHKLSDIKDRLAPASEAVDR